MIDPQAVYLRDRGGCGGINREGSASYSGHRKNDGEGTHPPFHVVQMFPMIASPSYNSSVFSEQQ